MILGIFGFLRRKPVTLDDILSHPDGKRYYRDTHRIRKEQLDEDALKVVHRLQKYGYKAFLVGGCIRDILLGRKPKDFDIVTNATPNQIKNLFSNSRIIGRRFKLVHIGFRGKVVEVSTFRSFPTHRFDGKSSRDADLLITRDNDFGSAKEDAARRDFTLNALFFDPRNESIVDYVGGYDDLASRVIRVIGDPDISFREDPARMMRAVKFSAMLGFRLIVRW